MYFTKSAYMVPLLIVGLGLTVNGYSQSFLTNGLVAYYPFSGNANDASGNGNNGTVYGATLTTDRFGMANNAYSLNGTGDYIKVLDAPANNLPAQFTISFWMKPNAGYGTPNDQWSWPEIIGKWGGGGVGFASYNIGINTSGHLIVATHDGVDPTTTAMDNSITKTGVWHQVVLVRDATSFRLYRDNVLLFSTNSLVQPQQNSIYNLNFGREEAINSNFYSGNLDDIRIYNRALSVSEVQQLYAIESGPRVDLIKAVKPSFSNLTLTTSYQMQISGDLNTWTNYGAAFTATNTSMIYPLYFDVDNWSSLYFRLKTTP
jgi:hypothetical protein